MSNRSLLAGPSLIPLLGTLLLGNLALARDRQDTQGEMVEWGKEIRVTALTRIDIPDVVKVDPDGTVRYQRRHERSGLVAVEVGDGTWHVPMPRTSWVGRLIAADEVTITLSRDEKPEEITIPWQALGKVEVRRGGSKAGLAILDGSFAGFMWCYRGAHNDHYDAAQSSFGGALCAIPGALIGGAVFAAVGGEGWKRVAPAKVRVIVGPRRGGAAASIVVSF